MQTMAQQKMTTLNKILIIKHGALGDMVQALDGFASIRAGHPDAHLALLTTPPFAGLAQAMPFFDEVIIDRRAKPWNLLALLEIRSILRGGWQRIYDLQSSRRTRRYLNHLIPSSVEFVGVHPGASHRLGDMTGINNRVRMVMAAEKGGCPNTAASTDWLDGGANGLAFDKPYAVLIPGCSPAKPEKRWPPERFADLAGMLLEQGLQPILAGTAVDQAAGDIITARQPDVLDQIGKTNLTELAALLRHADLVVGNDTGPVFLAARLDAPTVMVMSRHTDPSMSAPYGKRAGWIKDDAITTITPAKVMATAKNL